MFNNEYQDTILQRHKLVGDLGYIPVYWQKVNWNPLRYDGKFFATWINLIKENPSMYYLDEEYFNIGPGTMDEIRPAIIPPICVDQLAKNPDLIEYTDIQLSDYFIDILGMDNIGYIDYELLNQCIRIVKHGVTNRVYTQSFKTLLNLSDDIKEFIKSSNNACFESFVESFNIQDEEIEIARLAWPYEDMAKRYYEQYKEDINVNTFPDDFRSYPLYYLYPKEMVNTKPVALFCKLQVGLLPAGNTIGSVRKQRDYREDYLEILRRSILINLVFRNKYAKFKTPDYEKWRMITPEFVQQYFDEHPYTLPRDFFVENYLHMAPNKIVSSLCPYFLDYLFNLRTKKFWYSEKVYDFKGNLITEEYDRLKIWSRRRFRFDDIFEELDRCQEYLVDPQEHIDPKILEKLADIFCVSIKDLKNVILTKYYSAIYQSESMLYDFFDKYIDKIKELDSIRDVYGILEAPRASIQSFKTKLISYIEDNNLDLGEFEHLGILKRVTKQIQKHKIDGEQGHNRGIIDVHNLTIDQYLQLVENGELDEWFDVGNDIEKSGNDI